MAQYVYTKVVNTDKLKFEIAALELGQALSYLSTAGTELTVVFAGSLSEGDETTLDTAVAAHVPATTAESLEVFLNHSVKPFIESLICTFAAENIALGITQYGKTGHVLALFTKKYPVPDADYQNCLKDTFDTGSLYMSLAILQHIRDNSGEFSGLSPFITDARLLAMKNKIEVFLGVTPLST